MVTDQKLKYYESLPKREKVGFNIKSKSWFEDTFKKSSVEEYNRGSVYFFRVLDKSIGRSINTVIEQLRNSYKRNRHRSYKLCVENLINVYLLEKTSSTYRCKRDKFLIEDGIIREFREEKDSLYDSKPFKEFKKEYFNAYSNENIYNSLLKNIFKVSFTTGEIFFLIKGKYYLVLNTKGLKYKLEFYSNNLTEDFVRNYRLIGMDNLDLKEYGLVNIL